MLVTCGTLLPWRRTRLAAATAPRLQSAGMALPLRRLSDLPALIARALEDRALPAAALRFR